MKEIQQGMYRLQWLVDPRLPPSRGMASVVVQLRPSNETADDPFQLTHFRFKGMGADGSSTARVQRGESATARCASTEDHQAPSPSPVDSLSAALLDSAIQF